MPTITVAKSISKTLTSEQFVDLLFDFGLEIDEITETDYRIEIPANRHDLLCTAGLEAALRCYVEEEEYEEIRVKKGHYCVNANSSIRPFIACAVVKGIKFDDQRFLDFIDFQEKLNNGIGRNRKIVAIGSHDLRPLDFPLFYVDLKPKHIVYKPIRPIGEITMPHACLINSIEDGGNGEILSVVPLMNSDYSKMTVDTTDFFIEVTGTDLHKVNTVLKLLLSNFRGEEIFSVNTNNDPFPFLLNTTIDLSVDEVNSELGLELKRTEIERHLKRMMHGIGNEYLKEMSEAAKNNKELNGDLKDLNNKKELNNNKKELNNNYNNKELNNHVDADVIKVIVHDVRSDVISKIDLIEDIAISYGVNNFKRYLPTIDCAGRPVPLNRFVDKVREEMATLNFLEAVCLVLEPRHPFGQYSQLNLLKFKSQETECVRVSLLSGLMRAVSSNQHSTLPLKLFECGDVVLNRSNEKKIAGVIAGKTAKIEIIQGVITQLLEKCNVFDFEYEERDSLWFYSNRGGVIKVGNDVIGVFGIINSDVCKEFKVPLACTVFEIDTTLLFDLYKRPLIKKL